jgi:signal transduction histidine kinase
MKPENYHSVKMHFRFSGLWMIPTILFSLTFCSAFGQAKHMVQVKAFDQHLNPYKNIQVSINAKDYIALGLKGIAFMELSEDDLPLRSVKIKDDELEAASWNYTKGVVEIIVRKKSYQIVHVQVKDSRNNPAKDIKVTFAGRKTTTVTTDAEGHIELPLALDEKINAVDQFTMDDFNPDELQVNGKDVILTISPKVQAKRVDSHVQTDKTKADDNGAYFRDFDLSKLDSIRSLTVFYAIFKNYQMKNLSAAAKQQLDNKFNELVEDLQDSLQKNTDRFIGKISDSSFVSDDIRNLLSQATIENQTLDLQRAEFDEKIRLINDKLSAGIINLDSDTRTRLLSDLNKLEDLLANNESRFYKNQNDYRQIINSLKENYFNFEDLENKLNISESQRLEDQRVFRQRLLITISVVILFAILIIRLIYFSNKLRKQKKELQHANDEIASINANLEGTVLQRTKSLKEAHHELDTFLYRASHDLRSPVCSIIGLCNLASHFSTGEAKDLLDKVVDTTSGMDRLLKKLSLISEINQPSNFGLVNLSQTIESIRQHVSKAIYKQQILFVVNCPAELEIYTSPDLLQAILINLIENALFYCGMKNRNNGVVEISISIEHNQLEVQIYDNGIGIDSKITDRLYDMFFKGNVYSKGNGLGLYIVKKSVAALGGEISMESEAGKFTRFVIYLPLKDASFMQEQNDLQYADALLN